MLVNGIAHLYMLSYTKPFHFNQNERHFQQIEYGISLGIFCSDCSRQCRYVDEPDALYYLLYISY